MSLAHLFLDLNSYFASVEQQLEPSLRGRPVAVAPIHTPTGACIAASYEAKRFGVKTGTKVADALLMCPGLVLVKPRHRVYVEMHHRIIAAVESCAPVDGVHSIDEMTVRLAREERTPEAAVDLAMRIKRTIAKRVGDCLTSSIGIAPNRLIAKVASDMVKPNGLVVICKEELPGRLFGLVLRDLPGVGARMEERLAHVGVRTIEDLSRLTEREMERAWGSVIGRRWWHALRGADLLEAKTHRRSIGHQHVLAPERRNHAKAWEVVSRLLHKAAARARSIGYYATKLTLAVRLLDGRSWDQTQNFDGGTQDTLALQHALAAMWSNRPKSTPLCVGVTLHDLVHTNSATLPLFQEEQERAALSQAMDTLNTKIGRVAVYLGAMHEARDVATGGIAFRSIPNIALPDTAQHRGEDPTPRTKPVRAKDRTHEMQQARTQRHTQEAERSRQVHAVNEAQRAVEGDLAHEPRVVPIDEGSGDVLDPQHAKGRPKGSNDAGRNGASRNSGGRSDESRNEEERNDANRSGAERARQDTTGQDQVRQDTTRQDTTGRDRTGHEGRQEANHQGRQDEDPKDLNAGTIRLSAPLDEDDPRRRKSIGSWGG